MQRQIIVTGDGSHSVYIPDMNVTYHSVHGAVQESQHVFIESGFRYWSGRSNRPDQLSILEIGFGTGLNALLTAIALETTEVSTYYSAIEPHPLSIDVISSLNYCELLKRGYLQEDFIRMHECEWNKGLVVTENLLIHKSNKSLQTFEHSTKLDLVYFDAFAPDVQPELWTQSIFELLYNNMKVGGVLVTYCCKGDVRRAMIAAGFGVEKIPGPPHKREMLRAIKK